MDCITTVTYILNEPNTAEMQNIPA